MNSTQKVILFAVAAVITAMLAYPPFQVIDKLNVTHNMGYSWLLEPPRRLGISATVNSQMLMVQIIAVAFLGGILFLASKTIKKKPSESASPTTDASNSLPCGIGGWLLFLCISLTIITPAYAALSLFMFWREVSPFFSNNPDLRTAFHFFVAGSVFVCGYGVYAGYRLWVLKSDAVAKAKTYLWISLCFSVFGTIAFIVMADLPTTGALAYLQTAGIKDVLKGFIPFAIWYAYLKSSKRVRNTYPLL